MKYRGFDQNLQWFGLQYKIGKKYNKGQIGELFDDPFDPLRFFSPVCARYCKASQSYKLIKDEGRIKLVPSKVKLKKEIDVKEMIRDGIKFNIKNTANLKSGHSVVSTASGDCATCAANGVDSVSAVSGAGGTSVTKGCFGSAAISGYHGASAVSGDYSVSASCGEETLSASIGHCSTSASSGNECTSVSCGMLSTSVSSGVNGGSVTFGAGSVSVTNGAGGVAASKGDCSVAVTCGDDSWAIAEGADSVAIVTGYQSKAKASLGSAIVVVERGEYDGKSYPIKAICSAIVDGKKIKADTYYTVKDGVFVEVK